jgi:hypothetical protein
MSNPSRDNVQAQPRRDVRASHHENAQEHRENAQEHLHESAQEHLHENPKAGEAWSNRDKDPDEWTTGGEPMTGAQASYLKTLCEEAGEPFEPGLTKAEASKRIDELQARTGRGQPRHES